MGLNISIPIDVDAFALGLGSCDPKSKILIAPITQPAYVGLRLDSSIIQPDVLKPVDLHNATPREFNSRIANIEPDKPENQFKKNRLGVYIHWSLPRLYRTATAAAQGATGIPSPTGVKQPTSNPTFRRVPNRWLVVRHLKKSEPATKLGFSSWVVESDRVRRINDESLRNADLEVDVSPFVSHDEKDKDPLNTQTEVFIGNKVPAPGYREAPDGKYVPLTIMNSSNPLFPDYTPHNANVFSTNDNFSFINSKNETEYLTHAEADYFVLGWHSDSQQDPLNTSDQSLDNRLADLILQLDPKLSDADKDIGQRHRDKGRILCHGAIYNVVYDQNARTPSKAEKAVANFGSTVKMEPVSMGTNPIDSIINFLDAHKDDAEGERILGLDRKRLADMVSKVSDLVYASDDSFDTRLRAQDLKDRNEYAAADGGSAWLYAGKSERGEGPAIPTPSQQETLAKLNEIQARLDISTRQIKSLRWDLFAEWWKFVSDQTNKELNNLPPYRSRVSNIRSRLQTLISQAQNLDNRINGSADGKIQPDADFKSLPRKKVAKPAFYMRKDPTLCIAGLKSAWPTTYMDKVTVRIDAQIMGDNDSRLGAADDVFPLAQSPVPGDNYLQKTARKLLAEFVSKARNSSQTSPPGSRDWAGANPFSPLFIEYELLYYHISFDKWRVEDRSSPFGHATSTVRYSISGDRPLYSDADNQRDVRSVSGRTLILPQPAFDLETTVRQVLSKMTEQEREGSKTLLEDVKNLPFISTPLADVTNHLLTRSGGSHVKPNVRSLQDATLRALDRAIEAADLKSGNANESLDRQALEELIQSESALTPYGNLVDFSQIAESKIPFKGVTHGQMMFRKLNIIDKFGQAVALPDPRSRIRRGDEPPPSLYPCLSDSLSPSLLPNGNLNTIFQEDDVVKDKWPTSRFIELNPSINQDTRLNAAFVAPRMVQGKMTWQQTTDYDLPAGPVWGWVVVNYANLGLQFFTGDGTFYREVRKGGVDGTNTSEKWLPFDTPPGEKDKQLADYPQLDALISKLKADYLQNFFDVINSSIKTMPFPPSDYSQYANALVGKPLALVNVGWSLEMSAPAIKAQNTLGRTPNSQEWDILRSYKFPVKLGDAERPFDGMVAYWDSVNSPGNITTNFDQTFSYFVSSETKGFTSISPSNFPKLSPTYIEPDTAGNLLQLRARDYRITTMLIDPYTPIHAFSPILPITTLGLPPWCIQSAFKKITAFFRLGPQLLSRDVPKLYDVNAQATAESWSLPPKTDGKPAPIRLPISGKKGMWKWLQPYVVEGTTKFNSLDVGEEDTRIRNDPAPYTFVEGYLQLARPLLSSDIPKPQS